MSNSTNDVVQITRIITRGVIASRVVKREQNVTRVIARGIPGRDGVGNGTSYTYQQSVPNTIWTIPHNLGRYPSVTVVDSAGSQVYGDAIYVSSMIIRLEFSAAFSGTAYLN
jgi:hypothetical protein